MLACMMAPEVAEVCLAHLAHWKVQALGWPQTGHRNPSG